jgi:hypothetical protein
VLESQAWGDGLGDGVHLLNHVKVGV